MNEVWKISRIAPEFDVSNLGRVRTRDRLVNTCHNAKRLVKGRILKNHVLKSTGYQQVVGAGRKKYSVHRLVAMEFVTGYREGLVVNHINGIRDDNRLINLEWVTQAANNKHAFSVLGRRPSWIGKRSSDHPTSKAIVATCLSSGDQYRFGCALDAIRSGIGTDSGQISRCCAGKSKQHAGYRFAFAAENSVALRDTEAA